MDMRACTQVSSWHDWRPTQVLPLHLPTTHGSGTNSNGMTTAPLASCSLSYVPVLLLKTARSDYHHPTCTHRLCNAGCAVLTVCVLVCRSVATPEYQAVCLHAGDQHLALIIKKVSTDLFDDESQVLVICGGCRAHQAALHSALMGRSCLRPV